MHALLYRDPLVLRTSLGLSALVYRRLRDVRRVSSFPCHPDHPDRLYHLDRDPILYHLVDLYRSIYPHVRVLYSRDLTSTSQHLRGAKVLNCGGLETWSAGDQFPDVHLGLVRLVDRLWKT